MYREENSLPRKIMSDAKENQRDKTKQQSTIRNRELNHVIKGHRGKSERENDFI